jgi:hypothetical protein
MARFQLFGTWKPVDTGLPLLTLSSNGGVRVYLLEKPNDDLVGVWRIENNQRLVLVLEIRPVPDSGIDALCDEAKEALCFKIIECDETTLTLESEDGGNDVRYEKVIESK